jgi:hypothetical protein
MLFLKSKRDQRYAGRTSAIQSIRAGKDRPGLLERNIVQGMAPPFYRWRSWESQPTSGALLILTAYCVRHTM